MFRCLISEDEKIITHIKFKLSSSCSGGAYEFGELYRVSQ